MRVVRYVAALAVCGVIAAACENASTVDDSYYRLQMEWDLRNLVSAQDAYFTSNATYSVVPADLHFIPSYGVTVTVGAANTTGWNATSKHFDSSVICGVYAGNASSPIPGASKKEPACP